MAWDSVTEVVLIPPAVLHAWGPWWGGPRPPHLPDQPRLGDSLDNNTDALLLESTFEFYRFLQSDCQSASIIMHRACKYFSFSIQRSVGSTVTVTADLDVALPNLRLISSQPYAYIDSTDTQHRIVNPVNFRT